MKIRVISGKKLFSADVFMLSQTDQNARILAKTRFFCLIGALNVAFTIRILSPGKTKKKYLQEGIADYLKRLSHYVPIEWIPVPVKLRKQNIPIERILDKEAEAFAKYLENNHFLMVLDAKGKMFSSEEFSRFLQMKRNVGVPGIDFVIGGEWGLSEKIKNQADESLSLSRMTFTHDLTRLILLEQIYRAFTIIKGENYHK